MQSDKKIVSYHKIKKLTEKFKKQNKKTVLVTGCFDILHLGHLIFFNYAKSKGDILIVGLGSDETIKKYKGKGRPINNETLRSRLLAGLEIVDYVIICREPLVNYNMDHLKLTQRVKPDVYVVPLTDKKLEYKRKLIESIGGQFIACRRNPPNKIKGGISTTKIIEKSQEI
ncbi:MAG: D-beta-D-heptose 7-phosphate kinase / D-beta-D-heptose 1-phosphate adenosyltransferase [Candidatus Berkelbacteria bacterium Licking1014_7]|uniref:D-beta-D-heptose 7-phosphate kinase / D-beta-D-heptose 1-phosphate adenosyltransferase n=1 Tax=Candidatus Berkelbacteria bacterium Licking1014_7 TaxID=2017147 RepID=A0A554LJ13_9BACT|nr:MAG: D-beta-D-heptose 7-phosphate kinase / D-beta-D-heptose 1-phosphate adenosyltransferase [Candidatus Berkelbacteria bacterium Licking1014_7]